MGYEHIFLPDLIAEMRANAFFIFIRIWRYQNLKLISVYDTAMRGVYFEHISISAKEFGPPPSKIPLEEKK